MFVLICSNRICMIIYLFITHTHSSYAHPLIIHKNIYAYSKDENLRKFEACDIRKYLCMCVCKSDREKSKRKTRWKINIISCKWKYIHHIVVMFDSDENKLKYCNFLRQFCIFNHRIV